VWRDRAPSFQAEVEAVAVKAVAAWARRPVAGLSRAAVLWQPVPAMHFAIWLSYLHVELFRLSGASVTPASTLGLVVSLLIAVLLGHWARTLSRSFLIRRGGEGTAYAVARIVQYAVVAVVALFGLDNFGVSLSSFAALGAMLSVGVGFGLQNIVQNFVSGLILLVERPVQRGDFVRTGDVVGVVDEIAMRATRIITRDSVTIIVPNSELISGRVVNLSAPTTRYRARVTVGVAYGSDTALVKQTLLDVAGREERVLETPPPQVFFRDFADSAMAFELCVWLESPQEEPSITSALRFAIVAAFRTAGIDIPFPQRELRLRQDPPKVAPDVSV
jgi:small-conductance mechanosensitive channel